jgi:hypothetical protein
MSFGLST